MDRLKSFYVVGEETVSYVVTRALKQLGMRSVTDPKLADVVVTYFTAEPEVEDAYYDSEGLVQLANPGTYLVDLSPTSPHFANELFAVTSVSDLHFVSAPLAVIDQVAEDVFAKENLLVLAGGEPLHLEILTPLLEAFAQVRVVGEPAQAQMARAAHTINQTAKLVAAVEAQALFAAINDSALDFSGDLTAVLEALPADDARAEILAAATAKQFVGDYTTRMMVGEIAAALTAADDVELILPQLEAAMSLVELLDVVSTQPLAPAGMALLFGKEDEGKRFGLDWSRAKDLVVHGGGEYEDGFEEHDHVHVHDHDHEHHHHHDHDHDHFGWEDEAYGFDRFADDDSDDEY